MSDAVTDINETATGRDLEVVVYQRPRCPNCGSVKLRARHSKDQGDGSVLRYTRCQDCGKKFAVVAE